MDITGKTLQQISMTGDAVDIDMSGFAAGIYFVRYTDGINTELFKVVK